VPVHFLLEAKSRPAVLFFPTSIGVVHIPAAAAGRRALGHWQLVIVAHQEHFVLQGIHTGAALHITAASDAVIGVLCVVPEIIDGKSICLYGGGIRIAQPTTDQHHAGDDCEQNEECLEHAFSPPIRLRRRMLSVVIISHFAAMVTINSGHAGAAQDDRI
jgi:hypothetical protein